MNFSKASDLQLSKHVNWFVFCLNTFSNVILKKIRKFPRSLLQHTYASDFINFSFNSHKISGKHEHLLTSPLLISLSILTVRLTERMRN